MKEHILPCDVKRYLRKKILIRFIKALMLEIAVAAFILLLGERCFGALAPIVRGAIYTVLALIPIFLFKLPRLIADRPWQGVIRSVDIVTDSAMAMSGGGAGHLYTRNTVVLTLENADGRLFKKNARSAAALERKGNWEIVVKPEDLERGYPVGARVCHFRASEHLVVISFDEDFVTCAVCGTRNHADEGACFSCGYTLIK